MNSLYRVVDKTYFDIFWTNIALLITNIGQKNVAQILSTIYQIILIVLLLLLIIKQKFTHFQILQISSLRKVQLRSVNEYNLNIFVTRQILV